MEARLPRLSPYLIDWDNDGKPDLLIGDLSVVKRKGTGNVWLFLQE